MYSGSNCCMLHTINQRGVFSNLFCFIQIPCHTNLCYMFIFPFGMRKFKDLMNAQLYNYSSHSYLVNNQFINTTVVHFDYLALVNAYIIRKVNGHIFVCQGYRFVSFYSFSIGGWNCSESGIICFFILLIKTSTLQVSIIFSQR